MTPNTSLDRISIFRELLTATEPDIYCKKKPENKNVTTDMCGIMFDADIRIVYTAKIFKPLPYV